ncbi:MAG: universal stress protein [Acidobacteriota bacterium]
MNTETLAARFGQNTAVVISHIADDPARVLTAVQYAALGNRKVVLAQVAAAPRRAIPNGGPRRRKLASPAAQNASATRPPQWASTWSEILSRVFLLGKVPLEEIPQTVRTLGAQQLLLSSPQLAEEFWETTNTFETAETLAAPVWVLGPKIAAPVPKQIKRILMPLAFGIGFERPLKLASQIAGAWGATVAILHVVAPEENAWREPSSSLTANGRLQQFLQRLCDAHCRLELSIRGGDPAEAILKFDELEPHDLILLTCPEEFGVHRPFHGATRRILHEARCPVLLTRPDPEPRQRAVDLLIAQSPSQQPMFGRVSGVVQ